MKRTFLLAAWLSVLATIAQADDVPHVSMPLMQAQIDGACQAILSTARDPASAIENQKLYDCLYVREMVAAGCAEKGCPSPADWRKANGVFEPEMSRRFFLVKLTERLDALSGVQTINPR